MSKKIILLCLALLITVHAAYADSSKLLIRGYYGTKSVYSGSKNKVHIQLSNRAYYAIKNEGLEKIDIRLNNFKRTKNIKLDVKTTNAHLKGRNLVFSLPNNLLKHRGTHHLSVTTSNQSFNGSFNYAPTFEIINNTPGLEISVLPQEQPLPANEIGEGLVIESITEESAQTTSSENGLEISY